MAQKTQRNLIEAYFEWWLNEMVDSGYILKWDREPETILAHATIEYGRYKRFRRKEKIIEKFNLFGKVEYTYDYRIYWDRSAEYLFFEEVNDANIFQFGKPLFVANSEIDKDLNEIIYSDVDVKPTTSVMQMGGKVSSSITFPFKQRMIWKEYRRFINKVVPIPMAGTGYSSALFVISFTPKRYLFTDGGNMKRKIKFPFISIEQYVYTKKTEIEDLLNNTN